MQIPIFRGGGCVKKVKLDKLGKIITGNTPSKKILEFYDSNDIPFIKPDDFKTIDEISSSKGNKNYISENARNNARIVPQNSVLVTCIGVIGKVMISESELSFNQQINAIVPNELILSKYLAYLLLYNKSKLDFISNAPVVPIINKTQFSEFEVTFHENIDVQEMIIQKLENLDNQILKRRHQSKLLSNLVKSRFNEMFGDPLNNDKMFAVKTGQQCFKFSSGKLLDKNDRVFEGYPAYGGNGIAWKSRNYLIDNPTIIIGRVGAYCGNVRTSHGKAWISDNAIYIKEFKNLDFNLVFLLELMKVIDFSRFADFSGQPKITQKPLEKQKYIVPPLDLQNDFADFVAQVDKSQLAIQKSLDELETLKKSLMQEYFG